jgi:ectoine hydroxylase-related dioxygenase (phytanoyl-CoA dioxygenase family)
VTGVFTVTQPLPEEWAGGTYRFGDALIFHSLTVHRALPNHSERLRMSIDCRFQKLSEAIDPDSLLPLNGLSSWEPIYQGWQSRALQYYWHSMDLKYSRPVAISH